MAAKAKYAPDTTSEVPLADLRLYKSNPRKGNVGAVAASLQAHGQFRPIVANIGTHTNRRLEVLAGNHTLKAFRQLAQKHPDDPRWSKILVHWVDVDEDQAMRIVLVDNKTSEKGDYDNEVLLGVLSELRETDAGLGATGFTSDDLDHIAAEPVVIIGAGDEDDYVDADSIPDNAIGGRGAPVISYSIVFDTAEEKKAWIAFMNWLKVQMPECTVGERIVNYVEDQPALEAEREIDAD